MSVMPITPSSVGITQQVEQVNQLQVALTESKVDVFPNRDVAALEAGRDGRDGLGRAHAAKYTLGMRWPKNDSANGRDSFTS